MSLSSKFFSVSGEKFLKSFVRRTSVINSKRNFSTTVKDSHTVHEGKVKVDGIDINCAQVGSGEHPVLLLPGVMGSIWTDFKPQIDNLSRDEFRLVAWDPPGYGKSRPPDRTYPDDFLERDAILGCKLMKTLGHSKFSLLGWSDGGSTSLILAAKFPENIRRMVVISANAYALPKEFEFYESIRDINTWSARMRDPIVAVYGEEYFQKTWNAWIDTMVRPVSRDRGDICKSHLPSIQCPTLIVHGKKDVMIEGEHPYYLNKHIKNSQLRFFEDGAHNLHLRFPEEFNILASEFLTENSKMIGRENE